MAGYGEKNVLNSLLCSPKSSAEHQDGFLPIVFHRVSDSLVVLVELRLKCFIYLFKDFYHLLFSLFSKLNE